MDPYEDASPTFRLEEVEWEDGRRESDAVLNSRQGLLNLLATKKRDEERLRIKKEAVPISQHLDAEPVFLRADESRVIRAAE